MKIEPGNKFRTWNGTVVECICILLGEDIPYRYVMYHRKKDHMYRVDECGAAKNIPTELHLHEALSPLIIEVGKEYKTKEGNRVKCIDKLTADYPYPYVIYVIGKGKIYYINNLGEPLDSFIDWNIVDYWKE